jgi:DNA-binding transcriptional ArsR family regulator
MPLHGRDRNRISNTVARALAHPIRLRILELHTRDPARPLIASVLFPDVAEKLDNISLSQVNYHLRQLQKAGLLPDG